MNPIEQTLIRLFFITIGVFLLLKMNAQNLDKHQWKNRILIIQTAAESTAKYQEQVIEFSNLKTEFIERKLIVYHLIDNKYKVVNFQKAANDDEVLKAVTNKIFNQKEPFKIILIGLDGGIKLEKKELLKKEELFQLIDSMPMRRYELKDR